MGRLTDKIALITGGARGQGAAEFGSSPPRGHGAAHRRARRRGQATAAAIGPAAATFPRPSVSAASLGGGAFLLRARTPCLRRAILRRHRIAPQHHDQQLCPGHTDEIAASAGQSPSPDEPADRLLDAHGRSRRTCSADRTKAVQALIFSVWRTGNLGHSTYSAQVFSATSRVNVRVLLHGRNSSLAATVHLEEMVPAWTWRPTSSRCRAREVVALPRRPESGRRAADREPWPDRARLWTGRRQADGDARVTGRGRAGGPAASAPLLLQAIDRHRSHRRAVATSVGAGEVEADAVSGVGDGKIGDQTSISARPPTLRTIAARSRWVEAGMARRRGSWS